MWVSEQIKQEIQCFVYFFFKGTMSYGRLLGAGIHYPEMLLANRSLLYHCFELFAATCQLSSSELPLNAKAEDAVASYLVAIHNSDDLGATHAASVVKHAKVVYSPFWREFLRLAYCFCTNSFPDPIKYDYFPELDGAGTFAVPPFAIWTNVLQVAENHNPLNADDALRRANERYILMWDSGNGIEPFAEWELEQEIY